MSKVALIHDWLIHMRGGERVLEALAEIYPDATIYTLFHDRSQLSPTLQAMKIRTSFLHHIPGIKRFYRWLLPLLPMVIRTMKIDRDTEIVISSSHCVAKGIPIPRKALHVCYCHTPARYAWGFEQDYFGNFPKITKPLIKAMLHSFRRWDLKSARRVDFFIANSENVRSRIKHYYHRESEVIHPPLDTEQFHSLDLQGDYYLVVSAFVPYKRVDLVIETFNTLERDLLIAGSGPLREHYETLLRNPRIKFLGSVTDDALTSLYAKARALIFPTDEDFGIVPLEAQSCGTPVIAFGKGGALESVKTGVFFESQTTESLREAILKFEKNVYNRQEVSRKVQSFSRPRFQSEIKHALARYLKEKKDYAHK